MESVLETIRSWLRWRAEKRSSVLGWIGVFAGQGLAGVVLYAAFIFLMGAPLNAATIYAGAFFAVGCAISGVMFGLIWAILFTQIAGIGLGFSVGVWFNLPSWWTAAATEWSNGVSVPLLVVVIGLVLPPLWCLSCFIVHKGWIKVIDMILSRLMASITGRPSEADRRKAAAKDLKVSDTEADRAMRENETEPEGLTVINKSRIVREEHTGEDPEPEGESLYGSLAVDGNDEELDGLSESAAKSKQIVDASGAVISGEPEIKPSKPAFTDDFSSPFESQEKPTTAVRNEPKDGPENVAPERLRSEDRNRLIFVTDDYNVMMTQSSNENDALLDFMERHTSTLLGLTDQEIAFLRSLPDGAGLGVAEAAMQIQTNTSDMDTSFEKMVSAGLDAEDIIASRPTSEVSDEEEVEFEVKSLYEDLDVSDGDGEEAQAEVDSETTGEASTSFSDDFVPDFSFSGDEAAKSLSGRRVASLLSAAAFGSAGDRSEGFQSDMDDDDADDVAGDAEMSLEEAETPASEDSTAPSDANGSLTKSSDPVARKFELMQEGMSFQEAKAAVEREQAEALAESETVESEQPGDMQTEVEVSGSGSDEDRIPSEADVASGHPKDAEASDEIFGFEVDPAVEDQSTADPAQDTDHDEETHADDQVGDDEVAKDGDAGGTSDEGQEDTDMSIEVPLSWEQASAIFKTMNDTKLMPEGKYEALMRIENMEGNIDTVSAYRSKALIEHFGEKPAHDLKNQIIALFRDFKDSEAAKFGELASEAEAKIADMRQFPHKIDSSKLNLLAASASQMDALLKGNPSNMGMERKIRLSRIRADIENLKDLLESQTTPPARKSVAASEEGRRKAEDMIKSLSGHEVSVSTTEEDEGEGEEVDMAAVAADVGGEQEVMVQSPFADKPWLDPELGDLDEEFVLVPDGLDINTSQGAATLQERTALLARRVKAKEARDAFEQVEKAARAEREAEEGEERARVMKASEIAQKEENLVEREDDLARRETELAERLQELLKDKEEDAKALAEERKAMEEEKARIGERGKVLDRLSDVFKGDAEKKVEIVRFVSDNMSGLFSVREVPERFAQVNGMFMDLALARAIQKRVKGSSVGLQDALMSEGSEGLPERIFPNKLNMAFHGATVFRKSAEIVHKLATELEVEVSVPNAFEEEVNVQALMDACVSEEEKAFVADISNWMKSSRTEFFEMTKAMEDNVHDYRLARKIESSNVQDVEELAAANVQLKKDIEARDAELVEVRAALKLAETNRPARNAPSETIEGYVDSGTAAMEIHEMFDRENFTAPRGKGLREVGQRKVAIGLLDGNSGLPSKKKIMSELEAGSSLPVVIFTNAPDEEQEDISNHLAEFAQVTISFQPLDSDVAREFMLEEIRKIENE